jgi:hypothetical protein
MLAFCLSRRASIRADFNDYTAMVWSPIPRKVILPPLRLQAAMLETEHRAEPDRARSSLDANLFPRKSCAVLILGAVREDSKIGATRAFIEAWPISALREGTAACSSTQRANHHIVAMNDMTNLCITRVQPKRFERICSSYF